MSLESTVHCLFEEYAIVKPNDIAVVQNKRSLSYDELNKRANQLAHYLLKKNCTSDTPIAFCMSRSFECLITMLAILKAGAAYLPLDPSHPQERLLTLLQHSQTPLLITTASLQKKFTLHSGSLILIDHEQHEISQQATHNPDLAISPEQLAYVIYTSGSTGTPKGVLIEHKSVVNYCLWLAEYSCLQSKQRIDFSSNHAFDMAVTLSIAPLILGLTVVICDEETKRKVRDYLHHLHRFQIHCIKLTPSFFKILLEEVQNEFFALPYLKTIILGGENCPTLLCKSWLALYPQHRLHNEYGPTETCVGISQYTVFEGNVSDLGSNVPLGKVGPNIHALILDAQNTPVPIQEIGELHVGGICLARGYLNQPTATQKQFIPHPSNPKDRLYKTGDLCRLLPDGVLEYFGRIDEQIKIRGFRIDPCEIEKYLASHSMIKTVRVLAQKDAFDDDRLLAYYILKEEKQRPKPGQLRKYLQQQIPDYMIPSLFIPVTSFPLTANGKLDLFLLPKPQYLNSKTYKKPWTKLEKTLAAIWSKELGIEEGIGLDHDFFELGGHSLSAARIISKINHLLQQDLALHDLYQAPSLAKLAKMIKKNKKSLVKGNCSPHTPSQAPHTPSQAPHTSSQAPHTSSRAPHTSSRAQRGISETRYSATIEEIPRCARDDLRAATLPLSDFQFLLWMASRFEKKTKKINITTRKCFQGDLDKEALEWAFQQVLQQQEALRYRISTFSPVQCLQKKPHFSLVEKDLRSCSDQEAERVLENSIDQLIHFSWPKKSPLLTASLFHLNHRKVELQISLSHSISDDFSPDILWSDLSQFYLLYQQEALVKPLIEHTPYKEYIREEQKHFEQQVQRDLLFWEDYLQNAGLLKLPLSTVVKGNQRKAYSSYLPIPEKTLQHFKGFCAKKHISLKDGLCAALTLALQHCSSSIEQSTPFIYMNIIKSTRNNERYDHTIGCFLKLEAIQIAFNKNNTLESLAQEIHQSSIDTYPYQLCPDLIKLSAVNPFRQKLRAGFLMRLLSNFYAKTFSFPSIYRKIMQRCSERSFYFKQKNHFLININVHQSFMRESRQKSSPLFGLNPIQKKNKPYDLLNIDQILDVCFLRDQGDDLPYLVISANLQADFRVLIAKKCIQIMQDAISIPPFGPLLPKGEGSTEPFQRIH